MNTDRHQQGVTAGRRRLGVLSLLAALATSCAQAAPAPSPVSVAWVAPGAPAPVAPAIDVSGEWELRWDRAFAGWQPPLFEGKLTLQRAGEQWTGQLKFRQSVAQLTVESLRIEGDWLDVVFRHAAKDGKPTDEVELSGWIREGRLVGEIRWGKEIGWTPFGGRRVVVLHLRPGAVEHSLPAVDLSKTDADAVRTLVENATAERSSAIVVVKDGKLGVELYRDGYDGGPLIAMSASKSLVSLAVGMLVAEGKLSLDTRMGALFPEWKALGPKAAITVRQLLTHTSGLDPSRAAFATETIREHALAAKLVFPPGTRFQYNNGAVDFLAVVVKQAAGVPLDAYLETHLFQKLDVVGASWKKDPEGTPLGAGELFIRPVDLAKVGQLMLDGGTWQGQRILPAEWVERSADAGQSFDQSCGLLWWREGVFARVVDEPMLAAWKDLGVDAAALRGARALLGEKYKGYDAYRAALARALGSPALAKIEAAMAAGDHVPFNGLVSAGPVRGFSARGSLGQYLVVLPGKRIVAVRMRAPDGGDGGKGAQEKDRYHGFADDVARLF